MTSDEFDSNPGLTAAERKLREMEINRENPNQMTKPLLKLTLTFDQKPPLITNPNIRSKTSIDKAIATTTPADIVPKIPENEIEPNHEDVTKPNHNDVVKPNKHGYYDKTLKGHARKVSSIDFSNDGKYLVSAGREKLVRIWDMDSMECIKVLVHKNLIHVVKYAPFGKYLVSGGDDKTIKIWDVDTKTLKDTLEDHDNEDIDSSVRCLCFSPNGKTLVSGGYYKVKKWDLETMKRIPDLEGRTVSGKSFCYSPNGKFLISGGSDKLVRVWNTYTWVCFRRLKGHDGGVYSLSFAPDGKSFVSGDMSGKIKVWDVATWECTSTLEDHSKAVNCLVHSPDLEMEIFVSGSDDISTRLWDSKTRMCIGALIREGSNVNSVAFSSGGILARGFENGSIDLLFPNFKQYRTIMRNRNVQNGFIRNSVKLLEEGITEIESSKVEMSIFPLLYVLIIAEENYSDFALFLDAVWNVLVERTINKKGSSEYSCIKNVIEEFISNVLTEKPNLFPLLIKQANTKEELQRLAATKIMQKLITKLSIGGAMQLYYVEVALFITSLVMFAWTTWSITGTGSVDETIPSIITSMIFGILFFLRELLQMQSVYRKKFIYLYITDLWNLVDLISAAGVVITMILLLLTDVGEVYKHVASITAIFMWLKLLGVIKALNQKIAAFVLMFGTIITDVTPYFIVMTCAFFMFVHAFFVILGSDCNSDAESIGCDKFRTIPLTLTLVYGMVMDDYDLDDFPTTFTKTLAIIFMLVFVVVMLNVLIAIVSDSYNKAMVKSQELFWRARLELVGEISTTFQGLLTIIHNRQQCILNIPYDCIQFVLNWCMGIQPKTDPSGINLELNKGSSNEDEWTGRVLDIVHRINSHSTSYLEYLKSVSKSQKQDLTELKVEVKKLTSDLESKKGSSDEETRVSKSQKQDLTELKVDVNKLTSDLESNKGSSDEDTRTGKVLEIESMKFFDTVSESQNQDLTELKTDVNKLTRDYESQKKDISDVKEDLTELKVDMKELITVMRQIKDAKDLQKT